MNSYIEIEKARFGDKLKIIYDIPDNINCKLLPLIIQPIVENAIKHGGVGISEDKLKYLLKPVSEERLRKRVEQIISVKENEEAIDYNKLSRLIHDMKADTKSSPNIISLYHDNKLIPIEKNDIIYATIEDKETIIFTKKGRFEINCTLNKLLERLDSSIFFRTHKSYIVNLKSIE